jgi:hypothetical protein
MADQLTSDELRQVLADWISPYPPKQRRKIAGLFEAVIARAEAAEAEAEDAILAASDAAQREENAMHALSALPRPRGRTGGATGRARLAAGDGGVAAE